MAGGVMQRRLGFVGIIVDDREKTASAVNAVLSEHGGIIVGRMGMPYARKSCCVITLIVDASTDELGALTGNLGALQGVSVKSGLGKQSK
jgi:putative iron-only hydrogenase system regulator